MAEPAEKPIGRRAFIGLVVAGLVTLFVGKDTIGRISGGGDWPAGVSAFRINTVGPGAAFVESSWRLVVDGLVSKPLELTFAEVKALPRSRFTRDFYCVEGWGVKDVEWTGVTAGELMRTAGLDPRATHLVFYSSDGIYTDSLTTEEALRPDTLLAYELLGEPLPEKMGRPLRLVLPGSYAYKNVKWVVRVEAIAAGPEGYKGYWEQRGYPADASI